MYTFKDHCVNIIAWTVFPSSVQKNHHLKILLIQQKWWRRCSWYQEKNDTKIQNMNPLNKENNFYVYA